METGQVLSDAGVSAREAEVLDALAEHLTNAEVARRLSISIRTVESHVSALLRKLGVADRRELARLATELTGRRDEDGGSAEASEPEPPRPNLPAPLTSFVGRQVERTALATAVRESRLVTALGPGGQGKTRLALAVAADLATEYPDGVWYVDLVSVGDPAAVAVAVCDGLDIHLSGRPASDALVQALADRSALLVLDNCEHLLDGVGAFVEDLLARCPDVRVLATSRARLLVPFERVFPVPGLSLAEPTPSASSVDQLGDAARLFVERATAVGRPVVDAAELSRVAAICRALDGSALAIELAAARLPTLGLDGLEAGLDDRLRLLTGGSRRDERHSSLRAALDWSYALATPAEQALLRRVAVFAAPFDVASVAEVVGFAPLADDQPEVLADALARLTDESLLVMVTTPQGTRYRALETIRQYGWARLDDAGDTSELRERHLRWCRRMAAELEADLPKSLVEPLPADWPARFDVVAADIRAALRWLTTLADRNGDAHDLASTLARLAFERGQTESAMRHYEQAAASSEGAEAGAALRAGGDVACSRHVGEDALRLYLAAADVDERAGERARAAQELALAATLIRRGPGAFRTTPPDKEAADLISRAEALAGDDPVAQAGVAVAAAFDSSWDLDASEATALAHEAVHRAQAAGDAALESAALDILTVEQTALGDLAGATASTRRRTELLDRMPRCAAGAPELVDAYHMAAETHLGFGDLPAARHYSGRLRRQPAYREGQVTAVRLAIVEALAGEVDQAVRIGARFRAEWERVGRPVVPYLALGTSAVACAHGLRGDLEAHAEWLAITVPLQQRMDCIRDGLDISTPMLEIMVLLHRGELDEAVKAAAIDPRDLRQWSNGIWRQWYAALRAEAAALTDDPETAARLELADTYATGNPVATAMVARTRAWVAGDTARLLAAAQDLEDAGCSYQAARTRVFAAGRHRAEGQDALQALGASPMAMP